jgi:hypothetical protein
MPTVDAVRMVLAIVTELPLQLHAVEHDPFLDPPASDNATDIGVTDLDERVLTTEDSPVR